MGKTSNKLFYRNGTHDTHSRSRFHPTICTTSLSYAPLDADGNCLVTLIADHRVLDGAVVARALARLEEVLCHEMLAELRGLTACSPAAAGKACA